jgi:ABC-type branched-subunit amino acid transport system ATPase component
VASQAVTEVERPAHEAILSARGVRKTYGGVVAVNSLDLDVRPGEFLGVVGPNGAGKTTFFDLLTGYQRATAGSVRMLDRDVTGWSPYRIARLGVRRTFQVARPFGQLTVFENVYLGTVEAAGPDGRDGAEVAWHTLRAVGLEEQAHLPARSLVPAQLRLLEVGRTLAAGPLMVLLDEPLAGLTQPESQVLMRLLRSQQEAGLTIILVDHDIGTVASWADRLYVIDYGRRIADGPPKEVMRDERVIAAYLGSRWRAARG